MSYGKDEIKTQQNLRYYLQSGGVGPDLPVEYAGRQFAPMFIDGATISNGSETAINTQDPDNYKSFRRVGREISPPRLTYGYFAF